MDVAIDTTGTSSEDTDVLQNVLLASQELKHHRVSSSTVDRKCFINLLLVMSGFLSQKNTNP